ncbi:hypothetical protein ACFE04_030779 [Oxalis oulophora]
MKERKPVSVIERILVSCASQGKQYGACVAANIPAVERDICLKEFTALKNCMHNTPSTGLGGSAAVSHVYIQNPPLNCSLPESKGLYYDDGNKLLLSPTPDQVISWRTSPFNHLVAPTTDLISDGPILSIRFSLDAKLIAIQRSNVEIQFWLRETGETFSHRCKAESESILGFFWTDSPTCEMVIIKTSGLDFLAYNSTSKTVNVIETKKLSVTWYVYTHESRLLLLASGMQCKNFTGFQLSSAGIIRLPKFEMAMAKSESNSKPVLAAEDINLKVLPFYSYGRIYCLQVDRVAMLLHSYRFYRDAIVQQGSLPIYSSKIAISVVDNVLLVHQVDAKVVILYDIFADSRAPISAPLPLLLRGFPRSNSLSFRSVGKENENSETNSFTSNNESTIYGDDWTFLVPDLICDVANEILWKIQLDLEAISASSSEIPSVLEFLQRRKLEAYKAKQLCLAIARTVILERRPVSMVAKGIDVLVTSYSHSVKTGSYHKGLKTDKTNPPGVPNVSSSRPAADEHGKSIKHEVSNEQFNRSSTFSDSDSEGNGRLNRENLGGPESSGEVNSSSVQNRVSGPSNSLLNVNVEQLDSQLTSPAISPDEMYRFVFAPVDEEMVGDPSYLVAIIVEFLHSACLEKIKVHANLYVLVIQLLARNEQYAELGLFVINKIIEPSKEVAFQLLESGRQHFPTRKLGLDMLRQLSLHSDYLILLVQDGYYLEALRYMQKHKVTTVRPSLFLEAAYASNDTQHLAAVLRFFSDFLPGFRNTQDHNTYCHMLDEMNPSMATLC